MYDVTKNQRMTRGQIGKIKKLKFVPRLHTGNSLNFVFLPIHMPFPISTGDSVALCAIVVPHVLLQSELPPRNEVLQQPHADFIGGVLMGPTHATTLKKVDNTTSHFLDLKHSLKLAVEIISLISPCSHPLDPCLLQVNLSGLPLVLRVSAGVVYCYFMLWMQLT